MIFRTLPIPILGANLCLFCLDIDKPKVFIIDSGVDDILIKIVCTDCWRILKSLGFVRDN